MLGSGDKAKEERHKGFVSVSRGNVSGDNAIVKSDVGVANADMGNDKRNNGFVGIISASLLINTGIVRSKSLIA